MGIYLNPGKQLFERAVNSEIYVDKSVLLKFTNKCLFTENCFLAISRPRRFGKTMAMNMLSAYYGLGNDSAELFAPYRIAQEESFAKHLNKYHIIQINMRDCVTESNGDVAQMLSFLEEDIRQELSEIYPDIKLSAERSLSHGIEKVYASAGIPFVFLIDEWDAVFRVKGIREEEQTKYLDFLRSILKDKAYVALAYMTGILPIKKYGEHSALNMFTEYSMTNQRELAEFTGFTEGEVQELCREYDMPYDETKKWYDGYNLRGISIYNPRSVVMSMTGHDYDNYWTKTETYEALKVYICMNMDGLRDKVIRMIAGEHVAINTLKFVNDMVTFHSADDVLTLLIHLGYLTYDFDRKECFIPNQEVQQEFINSIEDGGWEEISIAIRDSAELIAATQRKDSAFVAEKLEQYHQNETSIMTYHNEAALASVLTVAYYAARKDYELIREQPAGKGYADICFLPRRGVTTPAMVAELKVDENADTAIDQIRRKDYVQGLTGYTGPVLLVGISYDRKTKKHSCVIKEISKPA